MKWKDANEKLEETSFHCFTISFLPVAQKRDDKPGTERILGIETCKFCG